MTSEPEVLIIGGGIIGLATAYYLVRRGYSGEVVLIEKEQNLLSHASGHNAGGISSSHLTHTSEMRALAKKTSELYLELSKMSGFDFDFQVNGSLEVKSNPSSKLERPTAITRSREKEDVRLELLRDPTEIREIEPNIAAERIKEAIYYPDDSQGNSLKLGQRFSRYCVQRGVKILTGTEVLRFQTAEQRVFSVSTNKGLIIPKNVVIACGPWSGKISSMLKLVIPVGPVKGHLITTHPTESKVLNTFVSGPNYYVLQNAEGSLVVAGGEDSVGFDSRVIDSRIEAAWREMTSLVPSLESLGQETTSACLRPFASDGLPIIGKSTRYSNLYFATGHFRNGFSLAPVTAQIISDLLTKGESPLDISPYSPSRFGA